MNCWQESERHETALKNAWFTFRSSFNAAMAKCPVGNVPADWTVTVMQTDPFGKTGTGAMGTGRISSPFRCGRSSIPPLALPAGAYWGNGFYIKLEKKRMKPG